MAFSGTKITFPTNEDVLFFGQNIFGHDFIHDFNTVSMSTRLSKIRSEIDEIQQQFQLGGVINSYPTDDSSLESLALSSVFHYEEGETLDMIPTDLNIIFDGIYKIDMVTKNRIITRAGLKLLQTAKNYIQESKLYVMGFMNSHATTGEITSLQNSLSVEVGTKRARSKGGRVPLMDSNSTIKPNTIGREIIDKKSKNEIHVYTQLNKSTKNKTFHKKKHDQSRYSQIRTAFDLVIHESKSASSEMKSYFECMKKLYLFFENEKNNPYVTFNNSYIENAMFLYILDPESFNTNEKIYNILQILITNNQDDKKYGGTKITFELIEQLKNEIEKDCKILFDFIEVGTMPNIDDLSPFFGYASKYKLTIEDLNEDSEINETKQLINQFKKIRSKYAVLETNNEKYVNTMTRGSARNKSQEIIRFLHALCDFIITFIHETISTFFNNREEILTKVDDSTLSGLTDVQTSNVQKISSTIAKGINDYIGIGNNTNRLLTYQNSILIDIANGKNFGSADKNLINAFRNLVKNNDKFVNPSKIKELLDKNKSQLRVIDNAASKETFMQLAINDNNVICPNSSIVDAMGSFGSCSKKSIPDSKREKQSVNFMISTEDEINSYIGQTIYKPNKQMVVTYYANFNEFVLPHVEFTIDLKSTANITTLSANITFKSIINKIISIWKNRLPQGVPVSSEDQWNILLNPPIFAELVSVGSLKSVGDLYQEINSVALNGAYIRQEIDDKIRNSFRVGLMGDRPSGVRAGYILLNATDGVHPTSMAGFVAKKENNNVVIISDSGLKEQKEQNKKRKKGGKNTKRRIKHNIKQSRKLKTK